MGLWDSLVDINKGIWGGGYLRDALKSGVGLLRGEGSGGYRKGLRALVEQERDSDRLFGDLAKEHLIAGNKARVSGYDAALDAASTVSREARRGAVKRGQQYEGELTQRYGAGGKFATTALEQARMGLQSSITEDLSSIDARFADIMGELQIGRGGAEAVGFNLLAAHEMDRSEQESELYRLLSNTLKQPKPGVLGGVLQAVGTGIGGLWGGPLGAGVGGELGGALGSAFERD